MQIGSKTNNRPFAWLPFVAYFALGVLVLVAIVVVFQALGAPTGGWLAYAVAGAIIGGMLGAVYPWLYDHIGPGRGSSR